MAWRDSLDDTVRRIIRHQVKGLINTALHPIQSERLHKAEIELIRSSYSQALNDGNIAEALGVFADINEKMRTDLKPWEIKPFPGETFLTEERFNALKAVYPQECKRLEATFAQPKKGMVK